MRLYPATASARPSGKTANYAEGGRTRVDSASPIPRENQEALKAGRAKGGLRTARKLRMTNLADLDLSGPEGIAEALEKLALGLAAGLIEESKAKALTQMLVKLSEVRDLKAVQDSLDEMEG